MPNNSCQPVLGKEEIEELDVTRMVFAVDGARDYFEQYADVFQGIRWLPVQHSIKIDSSAKPSAHAARFPQGILVKLKAKMNSLEHQNGIVKEVKSTEWVNSLVIVNEHNGDFRICICM